jgi:rhodanese-related sulfurtransferase
MQPKLHDIDPISAKQWLDQGDALLIDVREAIEFNDEYIPGAQLFPTSSFDPQALPEGQGKKLIFHCKGGKRSANAAIKWANVLGAPDTYHIKGGIEAWKKAGLATLSNRATSRSIQKLAYINSGVLILLGTLLAAIASPWFLLLPASAGLILLYAGLKGTSYLSYLLSKILSWFHS